MAANDNRKGKNSILEMAQMCVFVFGVAGSRTGLWIQEIFTGGRFLNTSWAKQWLQRNTTESQSSNLCQQRKRAIVFDLVDG